MSVVQKVVFTMQLINCTGTEEINDHEYEASWRLGGVKLQPNLYTIRWSLLCSPIIPANKVTTRISKTLFCVAVRSGSHDWTGKARQIARDGQLKGRTKLLLRLLFILRLSRELPVCTDWPSTVRALGVKCCVRL